MLQTDGRERKIDCCCRNGLPLARIPFPFWRLTWSCHSLFLSLPSDHPVRENVSTRASPISCREDEAIRWNGLSLGAGRNGRGSDYGDWQFSWVGPCLRGGHSSGPSLDNGVTMGAFDSSYTGEMAHHTGLLWTPHGAQNCSQANCATTVKFTLQKKSKEERKVQFTEELTEGMHQGNLQV